MNENQWKAISTNDSHFDGSFYYALSTTKTVCRPSCTSRTPNPRNVSIFSDVEAALAQGYRPCLRCKPEQTSWKGYKETLTEQIKSYLQIHYRESITLHRLSRQFNKNAFYIQRSFRQVEGKTPLQYMHQQRIEKAKQLLQENAYSITEVGLEVGYSDTSHFSSTFKEWEQVSPKVFREQ